VEAKFGVTVGKMNWIQDRSSWSLIGLDGKELGQFDGVVASDKNLVSPRFKEVHGVPPPLGPSIYYSFNNIANYSFYCLKILWCQKGIGIGDLHCKLVISRMVMSVLSVC
jgi:hypothetical protein